MQQNYNLASCENAFTLQGLSGEPFSMGASLFNVMRKKDVQGYPNYYVTDKGDVYSRNYNRTGKTQKLSPGKDSGGYLSVVLYRNLTRKTFRMHNLTANAFLSKPNRSVPLVINHKDTIKTNNNANNLEWCTRSENSLHAAKNDVGKMRGEKHFRAKLNEREVLEIRDKYKYRIYSALKLAKEYNVHVETVKCIIKRRSWKYI